MTKKTDEIGTLKRVNKLSRAPIEIDNDTWYYEEPKGVEIIHKQGHKYTHILIPWRKLRKSIIHAYAYDKGS